MKNSIEVSEKTHQMLEVKFARVSSDFLTSQRENQIIRQEFGFDRYMIYTYQGFPQAFWSKAVFCGRLSF